MLIPFGKYKGMTADRLYQIDPQYVSWMLSLDNIKGSLREALERAATGSSKPKSVTFQKVLLSRGTKNRIAVSFEFEKHLVEEFKYAIDGRSWNAEDNTWEVPKEQILRLLKLFKESAPIEIDDWVKTVIGEEYHRKKDLTALRKSEDYDFDPKTIIPLYPYQRVAIKFAERANGRVLIGDEMGVGKTPTAIGYATYGGLKTLVVCPKTIVTNWAREITKFSGKKATIWTTKEKIGRIDAKFHVINYEAVKAHIADLNKAGFDLLVCDEATYLKNRQTIRAKAVLGYYKERKKYPGIKTKHVLFLTGTPVLNNPTEAFQLLSFLDKNRFNNFMHFVDRYGGYRGSDPKNLDELHERTKDLVIRRSLKEVQPELPAKVRNDVYVELSPKERSAYYDQLMKLLNTWKLEKNPSVQHLPEIQNFLFGLKKSRTIEMIDEFISNDQGILVFSIYKEPLYQLKKHYGDKAVLLTGDVTKNNERQALIDKLSSGEAKIGLFTLGVGAMGIDKIQYEINTLLFLNLWFVPAIHDQAEGRLFRTGQTKKVQAYYLLCEDTIDENMRSILAEKQKLIDQIVDGKIVNYNPSKSFFKQFIKNLNAELGESLSENVELKGDLDDI